MSELAFARSECTWVADRLRPALQLLSLASNYATTTSCPEEALAVELCELLASGLSATDVRWLLLQGLVRHLSETTSPGNLERTFLAGDATVGRRSCFLFTEAGIEFASRLAIQNPEKASQRKLQTTTAGANAGPAAEDFPSYLSLSATPGVPRWDGMRQELWFEGRLVKQFRLPSPNQVTILAAFQEESWPARIDDPLPPSPELEPRRRLNDTIRNLNRSRITPSLRFLGDGTGQGVLWESGVAAAHPQ